MVKSWATCTMILNNLFQLSTNQLSVIQFGQFKVNETIHRPLKGQRFSLHKIGTTLVQACQYLSIHLLTTSPTAWSNLRKQIPFYFIINMLRLNTHTKM